MPKRRKIMDESKKVAPWKQQDDGLWRRPLVGPERMYDQWLELDGWTEWMGAVIFTVAPSLLSEVETNSNIETWFKKAIYHVFHRKLSLLATIERGEGDSATSRSRDFVYEPLTSDEDLAERITQRITIRHTAESVRNGLKSFTDDFYSSPEKRISFELGDHLIHFSFVVSSAEPGTFALAIRCNHALNDFWSGAGVLHEALRSLADGLIDDEPLLQFGRFTVLSTYGLHPCYLDLLADPTEDTSLSDEAREKARQLLAANLNNITSFPISEEPAKELADTDYSVRRQEFSQDMTEKIIKLCKNHGVTVTSFLTAMQALALLELFPPQDPARTMAAPICVSNRLRHTIYKYKDRSTGTLDPLNYVYKKGAIMGPIMASTFFITPFLVSVYDGPNDGHSWRTNVWKVAKSVGRATETEAKSNLCDHVDWTQGPAAFGGVSHMIEAMKAGQMPSPSGAFPPLSSAGLLDGVHLQESYGTIGKGKNKSPVIKLDDFSFCPRISTFFGHLKWWDLYNEKIERMVNESAMVGDV
ncbi:l diaminobutyrate decarboxylase [Fusarium heterosporum]|uniref:L diaminobutyrate decarboxylase n=1 Tax=Fusarium heterosporum TaxID=42747 RepID=A0A8H5TI51_FUSHE|nr:l diaminobutyrate decarboxylase [Fusarium heterosporum]